MQFLEKDITENPSPLVPLETLNKSWIVVGNGKELLVKNNPTKTTKEEEEKKTEYEIICTKRKNAKIELGEHVFVNGKWEILKEIKRGKSNNRI